ncbi:antitoxin phd [Candidatus Termititenax aidoneus]|uniref:Antitoxin phd n=1 Tax=Termititenax aidoneus TaxID=2218524 RepID=A0A388T8L0_TERA1|nr:antitoxin phd [Candidatus Termititenax aidoneus]
MQNVRAISELSKTEEISAFCHTVKEPVFLTKDGQKDMVAMSMETWEQNQAVADVYRKLGEAETALMNGALPLDGDEVFQQLKAKYAC